MVGSAGWSGDVSFTFQSSGGDAYTYAAAAQEPVRAVLFGTVDLRQSGRNVLCVAAGIADGLSQK